MTGKPVMIGDFSENQKRRRGDQTELHFKLTKLTLSQRPSPRFDTPVIAAVQLFHICLRAGSVHRRLATGSLTIYLVVRAAASDDCLLSCC